LGKIVGIIQSNYLPWKGYFDFIDSVDAFVFLDDVQFTKRDWRNRNFIKTHKGLQLLTVPVLTRGRYMQRICEVAVAGDHWAEEHLAAMRHAYARAPYFRSEIHWISDLLHTASRYALLSEINTFLIRRICERLGIKTRLYSSTIFDRSEGKNERLISICKQLNAERYLSGPAARSYIDESLWHREGIEVAYKSYDGYPEYPQLHGSFEHKVSIVDVLFHVGSEAYRYIKQSKQGKL